MSPRHRLVPPGAAAAWRSPRVCPTPPHTHTGGTPPPHPPTTPTITPTHTPPTIPTPLQLVGELKKRAAAQAALLQQLEERGPAAAVALTGAQPQALLGLAAATSPAGGPGQGPDLLQPGSAAAGLAGPGAEHGAAALGALAPLLSAGLAAGPASAFAGGVQDAGEGGWHDAARCTVEGCRICAYLARLARAEAAQQRGEPAPALAGGRQRGLAAAAAPTPTEQQPLQPQPQELPHDGQPFQPQQPWQPPPQPPPEQQQHHQLQPLQPASDETGVQTLPLLALQGLLSSFLPSSLESPLAAPGAAAQLGGADSAAGDPALLLLPANPGPGPADAAQLLATMHPALSPKGKRALCPRGQVQRSAWSRFLSSAGADAASPAARVVAQPQALHLLALIPPCSLHSHLPGGSVQPGGPSRHGPLAAAGGRHHPYPGGGPAVLFHRLPSAGL